MVEGWGVGLGEVPVVVRIFLLLWSLLGRGACIDGVFFFFFSVLLVLLMRRGEGREDAEGL